MTSLLAEGLSITLPLYPQMTDVEQDYVVDVLRNCYAALRGAVKRWGLFHSSIGRFCRYLGRDGSIGVNPCVE